MTQEIIEIENRRQDTESRCAIHLFKEGTFLRAYNWSAWLCCRYLHEFKINKRKSKISDTPIAYIGFPETSLGKWLPKNCEPIVENEKHYILQLYLDDSDSSNDTMFQRYNEWYENIPILENKRKEKDNKDEVNTNKTISISSIIQQIASFPVESKSPIECMLFVAELKKQISQMI